MSPAVQIGVCVALLVIDAAILYWRVIRRELEKYHRKHRYDDDLPPGPAVQQ